MDSGVQILSISTALAKHLNLEIKNLKTILDPEATGGSQIPYLGYVETKLWIPEVKPFDRDILMLVLLDSLHSDQVPVAIGTLHIDMLIQLATQEELESIGHCWKWGTVATKIAMDQMWLGGQMPIVDLIEKDVKLTRNITIQPSDTVQTIGLSKVPICNKGVNVIIEPSPVDR